MSTAARVDMEIYNNVTWQDAFRFGDDDDTSWSFTDKTFEMDVKASRDDAAALFTLTSGNGRIVVDDEVERVLHFNAEDPDFSVVLPAATYVYDLIMIDDVSGVRTQLMHGKVTVKVGVSD